MPHRAWVLGLSLLGAGPLHPLHSSRAEVAIRPDATFDITVRVFSDDLALAAPGGDSAQTAYLKRSFRIFTGQGSEVPVTVTAIRQDGEATHFTARARASMASDLSVQHGVLWERYDDQVNLVRVVRGARVTTLLFVRGDTPKPLQ